MPTYQSPPTYQTDKPRPSIELGENKYPGPQGRPVQAERDLSNFKWGGKKKKKLPIEGVQDSSGGEQIEGKQPEMRAMPQPGWNGPSGRNWEGRVPPGYDRNVIGGSFPGGGMKPPPFGGPISEMPVRPWNPGGGGKNVQVQPSYGSPTTRMPPQFEPGSPQDMYQQFQQWQTQGGGAPGQPPMSGPVTGTPAPGGRPGRQPLRPGMEYRPGGGQRPVGGGMQGAPQDGGVAQFDPNDPAQSGLVAGGQDPNQMNAWRQKLMQMQQQGPMNNKFYGAF